MEKLAQAPTCPGDEVVRDYVAGRLTDEEAEAFEQHYFACNRCWRELELVLEVRAAFAEPAAGAATVTPFRHRRTWHPGLRSLAAAAVLAFLAVSLSFWQVPVEQTPAPTFRGEDEPLELHLEVDGESLAVSCSEVSGAESYLLQLFSSEGELLLERESAVPRIVVATSALAPRQEGAELYGRVTALDSLRQEMASSALKQFLPEPEPRTQ